jgi:hypothetical protein
MRSNRPYVQLDPAVIEQARQMDLLTYLQHYGPSNLKRVGGNAYCTTEHDSLKISNGKWYWWSRGFGGVSALDYLIKVRSIPLWKLCRPSQARLVIGYRRPLLRRKTSRKNCYCRRKTRTATE